MNTTEGSAITKSYLEIIYKLNDVAKDIITCDVDYDKRISRRTISQLKENIDAMTAYYHNFKAIMAEKELGKNSYICSELFVNLTHILWQM